MMLCTEKGRPYVASVDRKMTEARLAGIRPGSPTRALSLLPNLVIEYDYVAPAVRCVYRESRRQLPGQAETPAHGNLRQGEHPSKGSQHCPRRSPTFFYHGGVFLLGEEEVRRLGATVVREEDEAGFIWFVAYSSFRGNQVKTVFFCRVCRVSRDNLCLPVLTNKKQQHGCACACRLRQSLNAGSTCDTLGLNLPEATNLTFGIFLALALC